MTKLYFTFKEGGAGAADPCDDGFGDFVGFDGVNKTVFILLLLRG